MANDPKEKYQKPPMGGGDLIPPGSSKNMKPQPDYGEKSYKGSGRLKNKAAIISGADSGIGRAVALAFAREGADIVFCYVNEEIEAGDAEETVALVEAEGRRAVAMQGDIKEERFCGKLADKALDEFGKIDILVNNAAYQMTFDSILDVTEDELEKAFRTNVFGAFFLSKAVFPKMKPGGSIINTVSIQAFHPSPELLPYAATKGALKIFTKAFSQETIKKGIRVNGVAPGPIWTPLIPSTMDDPKNFGKDNPTGRPGQPAELAPVYVLLASDEASYVNGEIWGVTGGAMAE
jgi:NAD(P)-dependent dehydrogenase (short-subunit alcohol dehydrogenase family)